MERLAAYESGRLIIVRGPEEFKLEVDPVYDSSGSEDLTCAGVLAMLVLGLFIFILLAGGLL